MAITIPLNTLRRKRQNIIDTIDYVYKVYCKYSLKPQDQLKSLSEVTLIDFHNKANKLERLVKEFEMIYGIWKRIDTKMLYVSMTPDVIDDHQDELMQRMFDIAKILQLYDFDKDAFDKRVRCSEMYQTIISE